MTYSVTLGGKTYDLFGKLETSILPQWAQQIRMTGELTREDRTPIPQYAPEDLTEGLGRKFYKSGKKQFHFGTCDTRFEGQVTLPLLKQTAGLTTIGATALLTSKAEYKGSLYTDWYVPTAAETVVENCEDAWSAGASGWTCSADTTDKVVGTASAKFVIPVGAAATTFAYEDITADNWQNKSLMLVFYVKSSVALAANDFILMLDDTSACASPLAQYYLPAISANEWRRVTLPLGDTSAAGWAAVASIGIKMQVDKGAMDLWLDDVRIVEDAVTATGKWNASNSKWEDNTDIEDTTNFVAARGGAHLVVHQTRFCALGKWGATFLTSRDGNTWSAPGGDYDHSTVDYSYMPNVGEGTFLLSSENTLYAIGWDAGSYVIRIAKTTDFGATAWTSVCSIASAGAATGAAVYYDESGNSFPFIGTREGAYLIDTTNSLAYLYVDLNQISSAYTGSKMCVWNGYLMVPSQNGLVRHYYATSLNKDVGLDKDDGIPADYQGPVTAMISILDKLYVAIKGATYAGIFCLDSNFAWHTVWLDGTASGEITHLWASGLATVPTLFFSTGANKHYFIEYIHANPLQLAAKYEASGYIDYMVFGGHLPEATAGFYKIGAYAHNLSATEKFTVSYGLNEAAPTTVSVGDITSTVRELALGTGSIGVEARVLQMRFTFARTTTNTLTPVLHYPVLDYRTMPAFSHVYYCQVDIDTSATTQSDTVANVVANLKTLGETRTLTAFVGGGNTENVLVDVVDIGYWLDSHTPPGAQYYAFLKLTEVQ